MKAPAPVKRPVLRFSRPDDERPKARRLFAVNGHCGLCVNAKDSCGMVVHVLNLGNPGAVRRSLDAGISPSKAQDAFRGSRTHLGG